MSAYRQGLSPEIRSAMALYDDSIGLESFLQRTTRYQNLRKWTPPVYHALKGIATCHLAYAYIATITGKPLGHEKVRYSSPVITLQVGLFHKENLRFLYPWSKAQNQNSLQKSTQYVAFQDVFSKQAATHFPPHRPWDCAIELLPGAQLPKGMEVYVPALITVNSTQQHVQQVLHRQTARLRGKSKSLGITSGHTASDTTGLTPFKCVLCYQPPLFPWTEEPSDVPAVDHWFRASEKVWDSAHHYLQRAVRCHKRFADTRKREAPLYQPGDQVWLSTLDLRLRLPCRKLSPRYIGPFRILRQFNNVTFQLQLPPRYRIHPTFHVSLLKPFSTFATDTTGAEAEPPPPEVLDQPSIYTVHEILDLRAEGPPGISHRLGGFYRSHPYCPAPRSRGHPLRCVRVSGAAPGGGGNVRHSPQPPPPSTSPVAPPTRSQSPEF
ncbi:Transposon Tf2-9 polyprotein [Labeo rohita]|uniref:Transposon Tf2-9 polyprotein n=1 Tax=Labeo rohita TaxID=84645 RepID=A0ABQ8MB01_LABRO|nr:Transposon Tf2-9 polyprotein [Labeo rohita]